MRRKSVRSSSVRATMRSRAALMPLTKGMGEELAKRVSAGAASWAKREAAKFSVADGDLLEILDAPEIAVLTHGSEIEARDAERLGANL